MENPSYTKKYIAAINEAEKDASISDQFKKICEEVALEHAKSIAMRVCGLSRQAKLYRKLLAAGLVKPAE